MLSAADWKRVYKDKEREAGIPENSGVPVLRRAAGAFCEVSAAQESADCLAKCLLRGAGRMILRSACFVWGCRSVLPRACPAEPGRFVLTNYPFRLIIKESRRRNGPA